MDNAGLIYIVIGFSVLGALVIFYCTRRSKWRWLIIPVRILSVLLLVIASVLIWYTHRPLPANTDRMLFKGIEYISEVRDGPISIHVVRVQLDTPGIHFLVTPYTLTRGWKLKGRTTSQFLSEFKLQVAINGDFFDPWRDNGVWDYYPHVGDGVNVRGLAASLGDVYTQGYTAPENYATLYIASDNRMSFNHPIGDIYNAISGNMMLVENGSPIPLKGANDYLTDRHPRTAVALDQTGQIFMMIVVDGRQPNYSEGVTIPELDTIIQSFGGFNALNLDGGGSVTLAAEGETGTPIVLNSPIHSHIPGMERPVANHLGLYADRLDQNG